MKLIDYDGTEVKLTLYRGEKVSALYKNGKLIFASYHDMVDQRIAEFCNTEFIYSEDFMLGKEVVIPGFSSEVASTLEEVASFTNALNAEIKQEMKNRQKAYDLRQKAEELLRQADDISPE